MSKKLKPAFTAYAAGINDIGLGLTEEAAGIVRCEHGYFEEALNGACPHCRLAKALACLKLIAENGGKLWVDSGCGTLSCNGSWCAEQAREVLKQLGEETK